MMVIHAHSVVCHRIHSSSIVKVEIALLNGSHDVSSAIGAPAELYVCGEINIHLFFGVRNGFLMFNMRLFHSRGSRCVCCRGWSLFSVADISCRCIVFPCRDNYDSVFCVKSINKVLRSSAHQCLNIF